MTLPSSGQLDYNSIRAEFAGPSSNVTLSTYYRGSSYTYPVGANSNITTSSSGQISVSNFHGAMGTARLAKANCSQWHSGGKLAQTNTGITGNSTWADSSGYWGGNNIGNWHAIYYLQAGFGVTGASCVWSSAIPTSATGTLKAYNSSASQLWQCDSTSMGNTNSWAVGFVGAGGAGTFSPSSPWPTSGDAYIES